MDNIRIVLVLCCLLALARPAEPTFRRKPILNYLVRYHLGKLRAAKGSLGLGHGHLGPLGLHHPEEEHYHHYYVQPLPYAHGAVPLQPPVILPDGHTGHSYFSLHTPHFTDLKYHHSFNLPQLQHDFDKFNF